MLPPNKLSAYIPVDRRRALARGQTLPDPARGAALFADISGFTPLTEALVKELGPKRGAEELSAQLNRVYDVLIASVDRHRGSVIIFSGDAITCWFEADDGLRAIACGLEMQQGMRQFASVPTPGGQPVSLAMKAAIAAGPARRFQVGDPQVQLIDVLAGETLDRMAAGEKHAGKGEVVVDDETLAGLTGRAHVQETRDGFAVIAGLAQPVAADPWEAGEGGLTEADLRPWILPPMFERLKTVQETLLAEMRLAVTLFVSFGGIDYDRDPAAGRKLDDYIRWVQRVLARYEGYLLQINIGDKGSYLYAAFGAPLAHDDDPARAVSAAAELRAPPPELSFIHDTHIGVSQGRLWSGAYGGASRHTYGVLGDVVNLAARLMGKAGPGEVLVTQPVAQAVEALYHVEPVGALQVKGKAEPVPAARVLERKHLSQAQPVRIYTTPLVGRERELEIMGQVLEQVVQRQGQILRLEGVAGLGKSHLTHEFSERAAARGLRSIVGASQSIGQDAYAPWRQVFRAFFALADAPGGESQAAQQMTQVEAAIRRVNPDWLVRLPLLGDLLGLPIPDNPTTAAFDPRLRQEALFALAVELIQHWAQAQPALVILEDLHWMDEASLGLTLALARVIARSPVLLLIVQRPPLRADRPYLPELDRLPGYHFLDLGELSPAGVAALIENRLRGPLSTLALALVQAQAQGNPFFTEELVDTLRESGGLAQDAEGRWALSEAIVEALHKANCLTRETADEEWQLAPNAQLSAVNLGIPDSVHGIVLSRIDRLPEAHKVTLKVASVIGRIFELELLAQAHPERPAMEELLAQIENLETRDFARLETPPPRRAYMFKHNITLEVAYDTLLESQQRELHLAVGETLERAQPEAVEQLAHHFSRSGARDKTLLYLDRAARKSQHEYANETALNYYTQALAMEDRWEWRQGQVDILHVLGRRDEEQSALQALEGAPDAPEVQTAYLWGQYHEAVGDYAASQAAIERGLAAARAQADRLAEARCLAQLGLIARRRGDYEGARTWYAQALPGLQSAEQPSPDEAQALTKALIGLGSVQRQQGDFETARQCFEQALALSRRAGNRAGEAEALNSLGGMAYYQRHVATAQSFYQQALDVMRAIGNRAGEGISLYSLAQASLDMGAYNQAETYYTSALVIQQAVGNRWEEGNVWNGLGVLYQELGDWPKAQNCLQHGLRLSQEIGDEAGQVYILANLGLVMRDQGDLAGAERLLRDGLGLAKKQEDKYTESYFLSHLGVTALRLGRPAEAIELAEQALAMRREIDLRLWTTADLATLAAAHQGLGQPDQALRLAQETLAILDECQGQGPEFPQRDYFICAQVLQAAGQAEAAQQARQSARQLVLARAEKIADPALRQSFLERVPINREILSLP